MPIAYMMSRFPHLPETFILREMSALEAQGWDVALYPLLVQEEAVVHPEAKRWLPRAHRFELSRVVAANLKALRQKPRQYFKLLARLVWENRSSPGFLARALIVFPYAIEAADMMTQQKIAHIHAHYATHPALAAWLIHRLTDIPYSVTVHAHDIFVNRTMLPTKLKDAAFVVAISQYNRDFLSRVVGPWTSDKTHVIHCGIEPAHYRVSRRSKPNNSQLSSLPYRKEPLEIISIGSLQAYKGQQYLVAACSMLYEKRIPFCCRIVGDGEERVRLENQIKQLGLEDHVVLLGAKTEAEVAELLAMANCYVQPSIVTPSGKMEGIPVALMEALAAELPVIASDLSGIPELVRPGETGYLVPAGNATALADALAQVYHHPEVGRALARAGRERVLAEFELQNNVQKLATLFEKAATDT
jgi:colanic acid/amylovoran biosynthesis glycosyltransferase